MLHKTNRLVGGIGYKGTDYPSYDGEKMLKEYSLWASMLLRCTDKYWDKHPTYVGTTCSENFKSYSYFYEWCQEQAGFGNKDEQGRYWSLDKDVLIKGNKLYSEDVCIFVPARINTLLTKSKATRGEYPIGVCWRDTKKMFVSQCNNGTGKQAYLGLFKTAQEAFQSYKTFKEALIKEVANEYKYQIDRRAFQALMKYAVEEME